MRRRYMRWFELRSVRVVADVISLALVFIETA